MGTISWLISTVLIIQILVPLGYYAGWRDDERFAWRMFSSFRMQSCEVTATALVDGRYGPLDLDRYLESQWINGMRLFHQPEVVRAILPWLCDQSAVEEIIIERECERPDGSSVRAWKMINRCGI